ncbi:hypothetical protein KUTeg_001080 [Tegillarca granosa]|uniref:Uncharacterized protein n=1 Tax=Tegillarca granosa TaxID=220873 RepID=A0ABQ9FZ13_TEGGR|nr:hypothetical protein KUTeg_001080 [Tegillarca granosa]
MWKKMSDRLSDFYRRFVVQEIVYPTIKTKNPIKACRLLFVQILSRATLNKKPCREKCRSLLQSHCKMALVRFEDGAGRLVKATGSFGRSKSVTINFYGGYTYLYICSQTCKAKISIGVDEYKQLLGMVGKATVDRINDTFKEQTKLLLRDIDCYQG